MSPRKLFDELNVRNFGTLWPRNRLLRVPEPRWGLGSFREIGGLPPPVGASPPKIAIGGDDD